MGSQVEREWSRMEYHSMTSVLTIYIDMMDKLFTNKLIKTKKHKGHMGKLWRLMSSVLIIQKYKDEGMKCTKISLFTWKQWLFKN